MANRKQIELQINCLWLNLYTILHAMKTPEQMHKQNQIRIKSYKITNRTRANLDTVS